MSPTGRPNAGPARSYAFPRSEKHRLSNGIALHIAPIRRLPSVTLLVTVEAGGERDPSARAGVGALTAQALAEGTMTRTADALADSFELLGGALDTDIGWTRSECSTTVLSTRATEALRLLAEVVRTPTFPPEDIERLRSERFAEILQQRTEPRGLADEMLSRVTYSAASRYALPEAGDEESVRRLLHADVVEHYRAHYGPGAVTLIVAGDIEVDPTVTLAERVFGDWQATVQTNRPITAESARDRCAVHVVAKPDASQTELRIGHLAIPRTHPDFYALTVMNAILGGLFNSRINLNLREAHGYTYGAHSAFEWHRAASLFLVSTAVGLEVTSDAVREVLREVERMREEQPQASEVTLARDYLTGVFPIRFETTAAIADAIASRESFFLESDYYDTYRERISNVTAADVLRVAQEHLRPDRLQLLAVGDASVTRHALEALGLGPVLSYSADGQLAGTEVGEN